MNYVRAVIALALLVSFMPLEAFSPKGPGAPTPMDCRLDTLYERVCKYESDIIELKEKVDSGDIVSLCCDNCNDEKFAELMKIAADIKKLVKENNGYACNLMGLLWMKTSSMAADCNICPDYFHFPASYPTCNENE